MLQYLKLLKLKQTLLLVFSGFTSMIVAAGKIPPPNILLPFLSSLGSAVAGATAVNMYFDRDIDSIMRRTRDRPLPRGNINPPWKAIALGLVLFLAGLSISTRLNYTVAATLSFGFVFDILVYNTGCGSRNWSSNIKNCG